jgi:hypothetical protein
MLLSERSVHAFFTTGPVVAFQVDDVDSARTTMEAAGIEFIGPVQRAGKMSWNHFRAPDGTVFCCRYQNIGRYCSSGLARTMNNNDPSDLWHQSRFAR